MKKLLLFLLVPLFIAKAVSAQQSDNDDKALKAYTPVKYETSYSLPSYIKKGSQLSGRKGTATGGSKWYIPYEMSDNAYLGQVLNTSGHNYLYHVGWDSTIYQRFVNQTTNVPFYGPVNWVAMAQLVDPIYALGFTQTAGGGSTESDILVRGSTPYTVDSIIFPGAYMKGITGGAVGTVDTFYFSVAPVSYDSAHTYTTADTPSAPYAKVVNYEDVTTHNGELKIIRLGVGSVDSLNRQFSTPGAIKWKVPIDPTLRQDMTASGTYPSHTFTFAVPNGGLTTTNTAFAISVAFKSGEPWTYQDSLEQHHYFMFMSSQAQAGSRMPYFYYTYNDRSMSYLMHNGGINRFADAIRLEMFNQDNFSEEFNYLGGHVVCNTCWDLNVSGVNKNLTSTAVYPNPANEEVNVPFMLNEPSDVRVSLVNMLGATVAEQTILNTANGKASFSTQHLNDGVYFYTVEAAGERKTGKVVIAH